MKTIYLLTGGIILAALLFFYYLVVRPRVLTPDEVPIAFWAWRTQTPRTVEVQNAFATTTAKTLFLHAGQFDIVGEAIQRIRPVTGALPHSVETHLVYNGTRRFLGDWDRLTPEVIAENVANTYLTDLSRVHNTQTDANGLQLDFDVPTRLLPMYAETLQQLRKLLPPNTKLSITGLATWTTAKDIELVLANVDFWIPQCYGTAIPINVNERTPISSSSEVGRIVDEARKLNKPFYAGLSAYGYAILYARDGGLLELRGDIEPVRAAQSSNLELIETYTFKGDREVGEIQYVYRVKSDALIDGLIIQTGEILVFDVPSIVSLRASARAVRENAGDLLLGICLFRLPTADDKTTLSVGEIAMALSDTQTKVATAITLKTTPNGRLNLSAENNGTARAILSEDAMTIDLAVPAGSIDSAFRFRGFTTYETLCGQIETGNPQPCSSLRANVIRIKATSWNPGTLAGATFGIKNKLPLNLSAIVTSHLNDGRIERELLNLKIQNGED